MSISFDTDIRPLFRDKDINEMREVSNLDLTSYEDVCAHAEKIYEQVETGWMPCDVPWSEDRVALFKRWMEEGCAH